jgi:hypothetical protein
MDPERTIDDARSVCQDLRGLFEQHGGPDSAEEVERLCEIAQLVTEDLRCRNRIRTVQRYAGYLLSGDHRRWARGTKSGRVFLCECVLNLLNAIDVRLESLVLKRRATRARSRARSTRLDSEAVRARVRARQRPKRAIAPRFGQA